MSFVGDFIGDVVGGITGAKQAGEAAERAGDVQAQAAKEAIAEQRRQFDKLVELMAPYVEVGIPAVEQQMALTGLRGAEAERAAIAQIEQSPQLQALARQGEEALLQQASATGGLRGGNIQAALAQFRPQLLQAEIDRRYGNLAGLTKIGQASAAGQAASGMDLASNVGNLTANAAQARAGGIIAGGNIPRQTFGDILKIGGTVSGFF